MKATRVMASAIVRGGEKSTIVPSKALRYALSPFAVPFWMLLATICVTVTWQLFSGLSWAPPSVAWFAAILSPCALIAVYIYKRGSPRAAEFSIFLGVSLLYPFVTTRLSYLVVTLNRPFVDSTLRHIDQRLGFDWLTWMHFVDGHPWFHIMHEALYPSIFYQSVLYLTVFSFARPMTRNFEMMFMSLAGVLISITVFAAFPTLGPAEGVGIKQQFADIIKEARTGSASNLPYTGLISFPSFHTFLAITYVYCARGIPFLFPAAVIINALMLITIPYGGDHNLIDMIAGAINALGCIYLCRRLYRLQAETRRRQ